MGAVDTDAILEDLRPYRDDDIEQLATLMHEARTWPPVGKPAPDDILMRWRRRHVTPETDVAVLPGPHGELIAYLLTTEWTEGVPRLGFELGVLPNFRRRGIGSALLEIAHRRCQQSALSYMTTPVHRLPEEGPPEGALFLERRGFKSEHRYWQMRLDDIGRQAKAQWPSGITWRRFEHAERDAQIWARLVRESFREDTTAESIVRQISEPGNDPQGYFFAVDAATGKEIGTSRARIDLYTGTPTGYLGTVGGLPDYRGRGIATALVQHTVNYLAGLGIHSATLFVEEGNIPARSLYAKLGWKPVYRTDHYWKRL